MIAIPAPWLSAILPFLVAAIVCAATVPLTALLAVRVGAVDQPDARRIHSEPTPRLGGIALFAGFAVALSLFGGAAGVRWQVVAIAGAVTVAMAVDDLLHLPWWTKLLVETAVACLVAAAGITIAFFALPGHTVQVVELGWLAAPVTVIWVVGMQTSINLLDGSDGVAAGVVAIVSAVCLVAAINRVGDAGDVQRGVIVLSAALAGCCLGFLVWNFPFPSGFPPVRVFMGDGGSHFLGVALAIITVLGVAKVAVALSLLAPLIALALPIGDTAFAIVRRRRAGHSLAMPDAGHLHHRLLARGMSPLETALTFYLATGILGCFALAIFGHRRSVVIGVVLLGIALVVILLRHRRRLGRYAAGADGYLLRHHGTASPTRMRHRGEVD